MADGYDRFENEGGGGGSFVMGLLTGTVLGAGLGMLFAPKSGSELRNQLSDQAGSLANTASDQYRRATETAGDWADRGREMYDRAKGAVSKGTEEAQRYVRDAAQSAKEMASNVTGGSSTYGAGSESVRGSGAEPMRGSSDQGTGSSHTQSGRGTTGGGRHS